jgi:hypothetical protein
VLLFGVVSHWILDILVHREDLRIIPLRGMRVGFGLWDQSKLFNLLLEYAVFLPGIFLFLQVHRTNQRFDVKIMVLVTILAISQFYMIYQMDGDLGYMDATLTFIFMIGLTTFSTFIDQQKAIVREKPRFD